MKEAGIDDTIIFNTLHSDKKGNSWICSIKIGQLKFICYPETFPNPVSAEEATAKKALEHFRQKTANKKTLLPTPVAVTSDFDVSVERVKDVSFVLYLC